MYCMNQCELNLLAAICKSQHDDIRNNKDQVQLALSFFSSFGMINNSLSELDNSSWHHSGYLVLFQ